MYTEKLKPKHSTQSSSIALFDTNLSQPLVSWGVTSNKFWMLASSFVTSSREPLNQPHLSSSSWLLRVRTLHLHIGSPMHQSGVCISSSTSRRQTTAVMVFLKFTINVQNFASVRW